jgi:hypothetical protein
VKDSTQLVSLKSDSSRWNETWPAENYAVKSSYLLGFLETVLGRVNPGKFNFFLR